MAERASTQTCTNSVAVKNETNRIGRARSVSRMESRKSLVEKIADSPVSAVDLFCGAGGLTHGLLQAGIKVEAGIDIDEQAKYAFVTNNPKTKYLAWDVGRKKSSSIEKLFAEGKYRLLAGCAPCQPFSKLTQAIENHQCWDLLNNFARFITRIKPELVTMENVPELAERGQEVFNHFIDTLKKLNYYVDWKIVKCQEYGVPQFRRRLVLLASKLGELKVPEGWSRSEKQWKTVRKTIGKLPRLESGEEHAKDLLHVASMLSELNLQRIKATSPNGGNRHEWPEELVLECHKKKTGKSYHSIYGRMWWDRPSPTMTTLCTGIGNGRFGHPEQHRSITLREAALLQSFPRSYQFWPSDTKLNRGAISRMIGNAVPPLLAKALGQTIMQHVAAHDSSSRSKGDLPKMNTRMVKVTSTRSEIIKQVKEKDTAAEFALRSALHGIGLRYQLHRKVEGVVVDIVFPTTKVLVFVDGCFWHGCPLHSTFPKSDQSYWLSKLAENKERDQRQTKKLSNAGWTVIRLWEHECMLTTQKTAQRIANAVSHGLQSKGQRNA